MAIDIVLYGRTGCPYTENAKKDLKKNGYIYKFIESTIKEIEKMTDGLRSTVPLIYINGKWIGGYNELVHWFKKQNGGGHHRRSPIKRKRKSMKRKSKRKTRKRKKTGRKRKKTGRKRKKTGRKRKKTGRKRKKR